MAQYKMQQIDSRFKIAFIYEGDEGQKIIEAPLPQQFGLTVGSEFTAPFDANALAGILQKFKLPFAGGISRRVGVVTTKFYSNPEPTEVSFEVEFHADVSAREEVVEPVVALMSMSLGRKMTTEAIDQEVEKAKGSFSKVIDLLGFKKSESQSAPQPGAVSVEDSITEFKDSYSEETAGALSFIGFIQGPNTVNVKFGELYTLYDVWVSSVGVQFSNVIDAEGYPLSATCSVTCVLQRDPVIEDLHRMFGVAAQEGA